MRGRECRGLGEARRWSNRRVSEREGGPKYKDGKGVRGEESEGSVHTVAEQKASGVARSISIQSQPRIQGFVGFGRQGQHGQA